MDLEIATVSKRMNNLAQLLPPMHDDTTLRSRRLQQEYRLTACEVRLTMLVTRGMLAREIATELGISINTVRSHLRNIFVKCEVSSQEALRNLVQTLR